MTRLGNKPRIFLIGNAAKPKVRETFERLASWLEKEDLLVGFDLDGHPEALRSAQPDYVIALGGDGTILHAGQAMQHRQVPIIGVNLGKLGYLADFDADELQSHFETVLNNDSLVSRRMMFDVQIDSPAGEASQGVALNDCVIRVGNPFRTVRLEMRIDDKPLCTLTGDGVILSTPTGSTAHNLSCDGPIVEPGVDAIIVNPICPHSFSHRPILVSPNSEVSIRIASQSLGAAAVLDGQRVHPLSSNACVKVRKSSESFQLVRNPTRTSWETLIRKLKWGQDVT